MNLIVIGLGLLAAVGMAIALSGVGAFGNLRVPNIDGSSVSLQHAATLRHGAHPTEVAVFEALPLLDRALAPLIHALASYLPRSDAANIELALDLLDYPRGYGSFAMVYAKQVGYALLGFSLGFGVAGLAMAAGSGPVLLLLLPAGLGILGYLTPRQWLRQQLSQRREQMVFEAPYLFDRLTVHYLATQSLPQGLVQMVSDAADAPSVGGAPAFEGGYLMRDLRQVAEDYLKSARLVDALRRMGKRNSDVPVIERFCERLVISEESGADVKQALSIMGDRAMALVENLIRQRGAENQALMILPTMAAMLGIFCVIALPMLSWIGKLF